MRQIGYIMLNVMDISDFSEKENINNNICGFPIVINTSLPNNMVGMMTDKDFYLYTYNFTTGISEIYHIKKGEYYGKSNC